MNSIPSLTPAGGQSSSFTPNGAPASISSAAADRATVSAVGSGIAQSSLDSDVRWEKVTSVRTALAAGTYNVPASHIASKIVDSMLGKQS